MEGLYQITSPYFCAGLTVENGKVTDAAPILCMRHWTEYEVIAKVKNNNWKLVKIDEQVA